MTGPNQVPPPCRFDLDPSRLRLRLDHVVPSDPAVLEEAVGKIVALIAQQGCHDRLADIELALHEALANAILHGNRRDPAKGVRVCVAVEENCGVLIVVKDAGSGFDPAHVPNPLDDRHRLLPNGRGIFLINQCMDDVRYCFDWGTTVRMRQYAAPAPQPDVTLYTLDGCVPCKQAREFLTKRGVAFRERNVLRDPEAMRELLRLDYSRMPVLVVGGQAVTGFHPEKIEKLLAQAAGPTTSPAPVQEN